jgi:glutamyl-tRNA reductase
MEVQREIIGKLISEKNITQCAVLCTCNRTEIYFCGTSDSCETVTELLSHLGGFENGEILEYIRTFSGSGTLSHLFKVACGIESMVLGEDEILGQTKSAYQTAVECGSVAYEMNTVFQSAIACAKKIKTETSLSCKSVSVATLTANEVAKSGENVNVLIIGSTGKIGSTVLKNLISHKNVSVTATLRCHNGNVLFSADSPVKTVDYSDRYSYMDSADCIISATSSPHCTITAPMLKKSLKTDKPRLLIDLAVPPDIDRNAEKISNIRLIGIDYFEQLASENNALKTGSVETAEIIIKDELDTLQKELAFHDFLPHAEEFNDRLKKNGGNSMLYALKSELDAEKFSEVISILNKWGQER